MKTRPAFASLLLLVGSTNALDAVPQGFFGNGVVPPVIPATPRFGSTNLTGAFLEIEAWESGELAGPWAQIEGSTLEEEAQGTTEHISPTKKRHY